MGRASTPLEMRKSPKRSGKVNSNKNSLLRSVFKPSRSPTNDRFKPLKQSSYNRPVLAPKSKLYTIDEESSDEPEKANERRDAHNISAETRFYRDLDLTDLSDAGEDENSDLSDFEGWDDEATLVAKFQENVPEQSEREKLASLAYQLEGPMQVRGALLKQYLAHTIAPAARKVKDVHSVLERKVDVTFGVCVLSFDDSCKKIEQLSLHDEEDLKRMYMDSQRNVRELFRQLKDAYQKRAKLWNDLHDAVDKSAANTIATLSFLPTELDNTVAAIEKKAKDVSKGGGVDGKAKQKLLRELLAEL